MDDNHRVRAESKSIATEEKLWLPPLSPKDQEKVNRLLRKSKNSSSNWTGFTNKTLWDWLQLLIVPLILVGIGFWFTAQQNVTNLQVSADQQRETTLKTYLDDMSDLLLNHHLRQSKPGDEASQVARERTLTTLRRLDTDRNRAVLQFLQDAHLISGKNAVIDLSNAVLFDADLGGANLRGAHLGGADLSSADLDQANLRGAHLDRANLFDADLHGADLFDADLHGANLRGARVTQDQLAKAQSLQGAIMPDGSKHP